MTRRQWPATFAELQAQVERAEAKYRPLVAALAPAELVALANVTGAALAGLKGEAAQENLRRGHRPPGTGIGNR